MLLRFIIIYVTMFTMMFFVIFWHVVHLTHHQHHKHIYHLLLQLEHLLLHCKFLWHTSLSFFITSWHITNCCCICIPIMLIILSREDFTSDLHFLHLYKNCLEKAQDFGGSLMGALVDEELMDPDPAPIAISV